MLRIFIGYDERERVAFNVLAHSIQRRASMPISITPLNRGTLAAVFERPRGRYESSDFALSRWIVPYLCDFQGWSVFMDCDMLCLGDVGELANYATLMDKYGVAARVVKHDYEPADEVKYLGALQTRYAMKNWSSVMLLNNALCRALTPDYVASAPGLDLHQFKWAGDPSRVRELPRRWNWLVGEPGYERPPADVALLHFTRGTPCFEGYQDQPGAELWRAELADMVAHEEQATKQVGRGFTASMAAEANAP